MLTYYSICYATIVLVGIKLKFCRLIFNFAEIFCLQYRYYTIKGKMTGPTNESGVCILTEIHPRLKAIGVKKIEVDFRNQHVVFIKGKT